MNFGVLNSAAKPLSLDLYWEIAIPTTFATIILPLIAGPIYRFFARRPHIVPGSLVMIFYLFITIFLTCLPFERSYAGRFSTPFFIIFILSGFLAIEEFFYLIPPVRELLGQQKNQTVMVVFSLLVHITVMGISLFLSLRHSDIPLLQLTYILPFFAAHFYFLIWNGMSPGFFSAMV